MIQELVNTAKNPAADIVARGWSIATLSEIGGLDVDEALLKIHQSDPPSAEKEGKQDKIANLGLRRIRMPSGLPATEHRLVQTWAAAARIALSGSAEALIEKAQLIQQFPAVARPISKRLVATMSGDDVSVEKLLQTSMQVLSLIHI